MARGKPKKAGWFTAERGGERMRQSFHRASHSTGITDSDLAVLAAVFSLTVGHSKLDDEPTLPQIATELGRWERPTPDDPRTPEQIEKARGKKTDRVGASLQKLAAVGSIVYEPGRGGRRSYIALPPVDDADSQPPATRGVGDVEQDRDRSSQPPAARGVGGTRDGTLNPPRRGPQPPARRGDDR